MELFQWIGIFILALAVLLQASDWFILAAEKIGAAIGIPPFIVGVTIVAAGTSLPELLTSIYAVLENSSEIVVGNVVGSNMANIFLVIGLTAIIGKEVKIDFDIMNVDMPLFMGSAFLLWFCLYDAVFSIPEAFLCLAGLVIFLSYTFSVGQEEGQRQVEEISKARVDWKVYATLIASGVLIKYGAEYTVKAIIGISDIIGYGKDVIAVTVVAFGTSLPEIIVSLKAAKKGNPELAFGNVLGSNIFNTFAVMGIPGLMGTLIIPAEVVEFSLPLMLAASAMFMVMMITKKISRWEGYMLFLFYVLFLIVSFSR